MIIREAVQKSFRSFSCLVPTEGTGVVMPHIGVVAVTGGAERSSRSVSWARGSWVLSEDMCLSHSSVTVGLRARKHPRCVLRPRPVGVRLPSRPLPREPLTSVSLPGAASRLFRMSGYTHTHTHTHLVTPKATAGTVAQETLQR